MRVTHIITRLVVGGAQENTLATVRGLRAHADLDVKLVSGPTMGPEGSLENAAREIYSDLPDGFSIVEELVRPVHPYKDLIALRRLETILKQQRPDIVHTHSGKAGILGRLAAKRAGVPIVIHHIHGPSFGPFQGPAANLAFTAAEKYAARVTDHFFCSSSAMTQIYLSVGIGRTEMFTRIFSGFDVSAFEKATNDIDHRRRLGFAPNDFIIGMISRFVPRKGHADLLTAFQNLLPACPEARLLLVGDGPLRPQIKSAVDRLGLSAKVVFTGLVNPSSVPDYVGIMDCLAHLSSFPEGLPRALPQALANGKPVLAYDFDGADEVCRNQETGCLIHSGDTNAAAQKLLELACNPSLRQQLGRNGARFVKNHFPIETMVSGQYHVYRQLAARRGIRS